MTAEDDTCVAVITGPGAHSYAEFLANCEKCAAVEDMYLVWAQGFMAALNIHRALQGAPAKNVRVHADVEQAARIRELHERRHPDGGYFFAVAAYFKSLPNCYALCH